MDAINRVPADRSHTHPGAIPAPEAPTDIRIKMRPAGR